MNDPDYPSWEAWFSAVGIANKNARQGPLFTLALMAMQAAIDGHGVALGQALLVEYDIAAGRLMRPFQIETALRLNYFLIYAADMAENPAFQAFHQWLLDEVAS